MNSNRLLSIRNISRIAILSAIAVILMLVDFPLPFIAPPFYKIDLSEIPVLIGGFAMGPMAAVCIEAMKVLLNLLFNGTTTAYVGEAANFLIGVSLVLPAAYLYKKEKTKKGAIKALLCGIVSMALVGGLLNYFVLIPTYVKFYHLPLETLISMGAAIFPVVSSKFLFVLCCVLPFNLLKGIAVSLVTALVYKRVSPLLH